MYPIDTQAKLMEKIEQHARAEDDILREGDKHPAEQTKGVTKKTARPEQKSYEKKKDYGQKDYGQGKKENGLL